MFADTLRVADKSPTLIPKSLWILSENPLVRECLIDKISAWFGDGIICAGARMRDLDLVLASRPTLVVVDASSGLFHCEMLECRNQSSGIDFIFVRHDVDAGAGAPEANFPEATVSLSELMSNLSAYFGKRESSVANHSAPIDGLTPRELEVARCLLDGKANKMIADELNLSCNTIKMYITQIMRKLGVSNRIQAVILLRDYKN